LKQTLIFLPVIGHSNQKYLIEAGNSIQLVIFFDVMSGLLGLQEIRNRFAAASISPTGYGAAPFVSGGTSPRSKVPTLLPYLNH
jgi:hypothetical protein